MPKPPPQRGRGIHVRFVSISWHDFAVLVLPVVLLCALAIGLMVYWVDPAPPRHITMSVGPRDSTFWPFAVQYRDILARDGITLNLEPSDGSVQNLERLADPKQNVQLGFVQGGVSEGIATQSLVSLGSMFYAPVVVFYRGANLTQLSQLAGMRIAVGRIGSGTRSLAINLLNANDMGPGSSTQLLPLDGEDAVQELIQGRVDAAILNGDSASRANMLRLQRMPGVSVMDFSQADAYTRRFYYLSELDLPPGVLDLGQNLPPQTVHLISPTVELVARNTLHPALSDLLIAAAQEVHGRSNVLQRAGEFPSPIAHDVFPISDDAQRYYKSGKSFLYRTLPFWLASLADRMLVVLVPLIVVLIPGLRIVPGLYAWRVKSRIYRWYGSLIAIERAAMSESTAEEREELMHRLDHIEDSVNRLKMPLAYADAFYVLREHIGFVRSRLTGAPLHPVSQD
ncbi:TAXI family TRAP transporter solute-binding subunit [Pararobbsia silviterrae]|uniref:C4-dicarboxylate ABC transporter substrate-binding protein n=1 Tax=Pararobbsia silviterrae TaxID=1792498 RepID=A0A494XQI5_9BURK|nr:TAXI family TRAP transporter solute-binding subunit [Pararobbsia silviterrae]RKP50384.1 C4-dicarboxylate ABC transporter substrate-binding protein [Pararobbsia silviterrae]